MCSVEKRNLSFFAKNFSKETCAASPIVSTGDAAQEFSSGLYALSVDIVIDDAILEPGVDAFDEQIHHGMGIERQIADLAYLHGLIRLHMLEAHGDLILADGQDVVVVGGLFRGSPAIRAGLWRRTPHRG